MAADQLLDALHKALTQAAVHLTLYTSKAGYSWMDTTGARATHRASRNWMVAVGYHLLLDVKWQ